VVRNSMMPLWQDRPERPLRLRFIWHSCWRTPGVARHADVISMRGIFHCAHLISQVPVPDC